MAKTPTLILASSSPYRKTLLEQLQLPFSCKQPNIDESAQAGESPIQLVQRLALEKAQAVAHTTSEPALIIGSDQVAMLDGQVLTKPGDHSRAIDQLSACQNREVQFFTGLCLYNNSTQQFELECIPFNVHFRPLTSQQIEHYLSREQPYQCAGSFMCEGLGIALFERFSGEDPNALIGLPLIKLTGMLNRAGMPVL